MSLADSSGRQLRTPHNAWGVSSPLSPRRILNLRILNLVVWSLFVTFTFGNLFSLFTGVVRVVWLLFAQEAVGGVVRVCVIVLVVDCLT